MSSRDKLFKLMQENPNLPLVFCCDSDELGEYAWTFYEDFGCDIVTIYKTEEQIYDHIIDIEEYYQDLYEDEYKDLSDKEFNKKIQDLIEHTEQYKAIRIYCK